jgi:hypothetical protein
MKSAHSTVLTEVASTEKNLGSKKNGDIAMDNDLGIYDRLGSSLATLVNGKTERLV